MADIATLGNDSQTVLIILLYHEGMQTVRLHAHKQTPKTVIKVLSLVHSI